MCYKSFGPSRCRLLEKIVESCSYSYKLLQLFIEIYNFLLYFSIIPLKRIFFSLISSKEIIEIIKKFSTNDIAHILNQPDIAFKRISITGYVLSFICLPRTVLTRKKGIGGVAI